MRQRLKLVVISCMIMLGSGAAIVLAQGLMADFGLKESELKQHMVSALVNGYLPAYPDRKVYKTAAPSVQAAFVKDTLSWAKAYTETEAFKADYAKQRAADKPAPDKAKGTPDEQYAKAMAEQRQAIENMKKSMAQMPPDMQKQMQETIKQLEANLAQSAKDPQMAAMMKQGFQQNAVASQKAYQDSVAAWEKKYPADPKVLIAARLRQFLALSQDVAFNAKLVPGGGGKMKFADPRYEAKSSEWKLCYRAGKEPVQAARTFAQDWLRQLEKKEGEKSGT